MLFDVKEKKEILEMFIDFYFNILVVVDKIKFCLSCFFWIYWCLLIII